MELNGTHVFVVFAARRRSKFCYIIDAAAGRVAVVLAVYVATVKHNEPDKDIEDGRHIVAIEVQIRVI